MPRIFLSEPELEFITDWLSEGIVRSSYYTKNQLSMYLELYKKICNKFIKNSKYKGILRAIMELNIRKFNKKIQRTKKR